jgi:hypothetical protein
MGCVDVDLHLEVLKLPHQLGHEAHIPRDLQALAFEWCYGTAYQVSLRDVVGASPLASEMPSVMETGR